MAILVPCPSAPNIKPQVYPFLATLPSQLLQIWTWWSPYLKAAPSYIRGSTDHLHHCHQDSTIKRLWSSQDASLLCSLADFISFFFFSSLPEPLFYYPCASSQIPSYQTAHVQNHSHEKQVALDYVQSGYYYLYKWRLHNLSGPLIPVFDHP